MDFKLILKKLNKSLTEEETTIFSIWYNESKKHKTYFKKVKANYTNNPESINTNKAWKAVENKIEDPRKNNSFWKYGVAASILLFMALSYFFVTKENSNAINTIVINSDISAGTNKATLTLEDGTTIALKKGEYFSGLHLDSNGEQLIYKSETTIEPETEYNYLTVPLGGEFYVELSDNTKVWLNSGSKLKYPVTFKEGETRVIELIYGEAYFDVSPSTDHDGSSFIVITKNQDIEVLGTAFNIRSYKNEDNIYTSLIEGKVNVKTSNTSKNLIPGQQSIVNTSTNSLIIIQLEDIERQIAWKNGLFMFDKKPLYEIMTTLSRWYDIPFEFEDIEKQHIIFSGVLDRDEGITDLLNNFQKTGEVSFRIIDQNILIN